MAFKDAKTSDSEPFLVSEELSEDGDATDEPTRQGLRTRRSTLLQSFPLHWLMVHLLPFAAYTLAFFYITRSVVQNDRSSGVSLPFPAQEAIKWESRRFPTKLEDNPFTGDPRPELDEAWHNLLQNDNIYVPTKDMKALGLKSIFLSDGSGQVTSLSVFHSLHCLKKVRHMIYHDYYHTGKDDDAMQRELKHVDHCVEYIREALMCHPDLSLISFRWLNETSQHPDEPEARYPTNYDGCHHQCANWDALNTWAGQRRFDLSNVQDLQKPKDGLRYQPEELRELESASMG